MLTVDVINLWEGEEGGRDTQRERWGERGGREREREIQRKKQRENFQLNSVGKQAVTESAIPKLDYTRI